VSRRTVRHLPVGQLIGRFAITDAALLEAERLLPSYRGPDGDHEGIIFLLGLEVPTLTVFLGALAPLADHGVGHVLCSAEQVLRSSRAARAAGISILGQLHSHPTGETSHSKGDDSLVLMPFEGMLSIVAPHYGRVGLRPLDGLGVHQFQGGRWVMCTPATVRQAFRIVPSSIDLR
jgi:hypothetical protein